MDFQKRMNRLLRLISVVILLSLASLQAFAQQHAFNDEIVAFKKHDSIAAPPKNAILFVGSSSFRKWTDVHAAFPEKTIINMWFGGSTTP